MEIGASDAPASFGSSVLSLCRRSAGPAPDGQINRSGVRPRRHAKIYENGTARAPQRPAVSRTAGPHAIGQVNRRSAPPTRVKTLAKNVCASALQKNAPSFQSTRRARRRRRR